MLAKGKHQPSIEVTKSDPEMQKDLQIYSDRSGRTLNVGNGDGASIRGLFAAAGESGSLLLTGGEHACSADCRRN